jgi:hypothetical protein
MDIMPDNTTALAVTNSNSISSFVHYRFNDW